jgi:RNA polymerase sigma-70 factor (ECF subfamily)
MLLEPSMLTMWGSLGESARVRPRACSMVEPKALAPIANVADARVEPAPDAALRALDEAMERYARGEDPAFDELYRRAAPRLRGFLVRLCGDATLADDLTQEALLRAHRARGSFEAGAAALPWLLAIARNAFLDSTRRARTRASVGGRAARRADDAAEPPEGEAPPSGRGDEALAAREMLAVVRTTLAAMPSLQREAFILLRFEGLTVSEAAQVLGTTEGAVKLRAFRAYEALRAALGHPGQSGKGG